MMGAKKMPGMGMMGGGKKKNVMKKGGKKRMSSKKPRNVEQLKSVAAA